MKVYIAGPMRGYPEFNFPAFDAARDRAKALGHVPVSPADLDRAEGFDASQTEGQYGFNARDAIVRDIMALSKCDAIALLPGWEKSKGVAVELNAARFMDLEILDALTFELLKIPS
jgi:hypothetical protein